MWGTLRRILNRPATSPDRAATNQPSYPKHVPRQRGRVPYGNQRLQSPGPDRTPVNHGRFVGVYRTADATTTNGLPTASGASILNGGASTLNDSASNGNIRLRPWHIRNRRFTLRWRGLAPRALEACTTPGPPPEQLKPPRPNRPRGFVASC